MHFEAGYNHQNIFLNLACKTVLGFSAIDHSSVGRLRVDGYQKHLKEAVIPL